MNKPGYYSYFTHAEKRGYSGVALWTKKEPINVTDKLGISRFDNEGRYIRADFPEFILSLIHI